MDMAIGRLQIYQNNYTVATYSSGTNQSFFIEFSAKCGNKNYTTYKKIKTNNDTKPNKFLDATSG